DRPSQGRDPQPDQVARLAPGHGAPARRRLRDHRGPGGPGRVTRSASLERARLRHGAGPSRVRGRRRGAPARGPDRRRGTVTFTTNGRTVTELLPISPSLRAAAGQVPPGD